MPDRPPTGSLRPWERRALRFLLTHLVSGVVGSIVVSTALLIFDIGHLGTLIRHSDEPLVALFLLYGSMAATFGSVAMGVAIMSLGEDRN